MPFANPSREPPAPRDHFPTNPVSAFSGSVAFPPPRITQPERTVLGDVAVSPAPRDGVACLSFGPQSTAGTANNESASPSFYHFQPEEGSSTMLAAGCWDSKTRVWSVKSQSLSSSLTFEISANAPVMSVAWLPGDGHLRLFTCDSNVDMNDLEVMQKQTIGYHGGPVSACKYAESLNALITASWDKMVKLWDPRAAASGPSTQIVEKSSDSTFGARTGDLTASSIVGTAGDAVSAAPEPQTAVDSSESQPSLSPPPSTLPSDSLPTANATGVSLPVNGFELGSSVVSSTGSAFAPPAGLSSSANVGFLNPVPQTGLGSAGFGGDSAGMPGGDTAAMTLPLPDRAYTMDVGGDLAVVGTAGRRILLYDLRSPGQPMSNFESPLKYQTRVVSLFPDCTGYAIGSIEGRVAIHHVSATDQQRNFAFKCHRENNGEDIYAVNSIVFHRQYGTFATAGADGTFNFWDKDSKQRLKAFEKGPAPIAAADFSRKGDLFAYASCYDWSKGASAHNPESSNMIYLHPVTDAEIRQRQRNASARRR